MEPGKVEFIYKDRNVHNIPMDCSREPSNIGKFSSEVYLAYREYLGTPTVIVFAFILLGIGMVILEQAQISTVDHVRERLNSLVFGDANATREILNSAAATLITITSITFTVLLLAVQQAASAMSTQIIDQFLRRPINQVLFGYFVGMSIYTLIVLAAVRSDFSPVLSTVLAFIFAGIALYFLVALVYITLTQMRSAIVIHAIHDETLKARKRQLPLLARTYRTPQLKGKHTVSLRSRGDGYLSDIKLPALEKTLLKCKGQLEVVLRVRIGSYVAHGDEVAEIRTVALMDTKKLQEQLLRNLKLTRARDLQRDTAHGVEQIMNIGWTSISSAQHSPTAGAQAIHALRDLLAEWSIAKEEPADEEKRLPIVYEDNIAVLPLRGIESLAVAAVESRQHQSFSHVLQAIATMFDRLSPEMRTKAEEIILRLLPALKSHMFTTELDEALQAVANTLSDVGRQKLSESVRRVRSEERAEVAQSAK